MSLVLWIFFCFGACCFSVSVGLKLRVSGIERPWVIHVGDDVKLRCDFEIEDALLYSIKWYKDHQEFFRYVPSETPSYQNFPVNGANIDIDRSWNDTIYLKDVDKESQGSYMCIITAYPPFFTVNVEAVLVIKDIPMRKNYTAGQSNSMQHPYSSLLAIIIMLIVLWIT